MDCELEFITNASGSPHCPFCASPLFVTVYSILKSLKDTQAKLDKFLNDFRTFKGKLKDDIYRQEP